MLPTITERTCPVCKELKHIKDYHNNKARYDGHDPYCKTCKTQKIKDYRQTPEGKKVARRAAIKWQQSNKEHINAYQTEYRLKNKIKAVKYLGDCCKICKLSFPYAVYDFHHRNPLEKDFHPAAILARNWEFIQRELDKCDLLCANCHRIVHHGDNNDNSF